MSIYLTFLEEDNKMSIFEKYAAFKVVAIFSTIY